MPDNTVEEQQRLYATPESSMVSNSSNFSTSDENLVGSDHNNNFDNSPVQTIQSVRNASLQNTSVRNTSGLNQSVRNTSVHNTSIHNHPTVNNNSPVDTESITSENLSTDSSSQPSRLKKLAKYINFKKSEYLRAFAMFCYAGTCTLVCSFLLILTHMRLDKRARTEPLQDVISEFITPDPEPYEQLFKICESATGIYVILLLSISAYRDDRAKICARFFFTFGTLFLYRGFLMYMTLLPRPSKSLNCEYVIERRSQIISDTITFWLSMGLSANGEHKYCGDYMYSGHTATILCLHLYILEYFPTSKTKGLKFVRTFVFDNFPWAMRFKYWKMVMKIPMAVFSTVAILAILITHNHYTIDVVIAYFFATREFMLYHSSFKLGLQHANTRVIKATPGKEEVEVVNDTIEHHAHVQNVQVNRNRSDVGIVIEQGETTQRPLAQVETYEFVSDQGYTQFQSNSRNNSGDSDGSKSSDKIDHNLHGWWWPIFRWLEQDTW